MKCANSPLIETVFCRAFRFLRHETYMHLTQPYSNNGIHFCECVCWNKCGGDSDFTSSRIINRYLLSPLSLAAMFCRAKPYWVTLIPIECRGLFFEKTEILFFFVCLFCTFCFSIYSLLLRVKRPFVRPQYSIRLWDSKPTNNCP